MSQIAEWFAPSLLRTSLTLIVAALFVATCVKCGASVRPSFGTPPCAIIERPAAPPSGL